MAAASSQAGGGGGYSVSNSVILNQPDDAYFERTFGTPTDNKKWTYSTWVKRGKLSDDMTFGLGCVVSSSGSKAAYMNFGPSNADSLHFYNEYYSGTGSTGNITTNNLLRDPHAWYHVVMIYDSNNDITTERMKLFCNGQLVSNNGTATYPTDGTQPPTNSAAVHQLGKVSTIYNFDGYLAECVFCDGQAYGPENFGEYDSNGVWRPLDPSGLTFGANGFYLNFDDSSDLGNDSSGNNNDWTANNLASTDQSTDTPTNNQCVLTPLYKNSSITLSEGNLKATGNSGGYYLSFSSMAIPKTGKWVCEFEVEAADTYPASLNFYVLGIAKIGDNTTLTGTSTGYYLNIGTGEIQAYSGVVTDTGGPRSGTFRIEYDADNDTITIFNNDSEVFPASSGVSNVTGLSGQDELHFAAGTYLRCTARFSHLTETPTTDFKELSAANLATPTIKNAQKYFDTFRYLGNGKGRQVGSWQPVTDPYTVSNSAAFKKEDSCELDQTFGSAASSDTDGTLSVWFKNSSNYGSAGHHFMMAENTSGDVIKIESDGDIHISLDNYFHGRWLSDFEILDIDIWHHLVIAFDLDATSASDRLTVYFDGVDVTGLGTIDYTFQDTFKIGQNTIANTIGGRAGSTTNSDYLFDGLMAEYCWCDGQVLSADSFGQIDTTTNKWVPKDVSGLTFGNNGWYLNFADKNDLGDDESGNGNDWTESGFDTTNGSNQYHDTPTRQFATFNPFEMGTTSTSVEDCMLHFTSSASGTHEQAIRSTFQNPKSGKWYAEYEVFNVSGYPTIIPFCSLDYNFQQSTFAIGDADYGIRFNSAGECAIVYNNVPSYMTITGLSYTTGDVVQIAIDCDNDQFWMGVNDSWNAELGGDPDAGGAGTHFPFSTVDGTMFNASSYASRDLTINFGQWQYFASTDLSETSAAGGHFKYTPPTGFKACQNDNVKSLDSFQTALNWTKNLDATDNWMVFDRVRGPYLDWHTNSINQQATNYNTLQRFLKHGQEVGEDVEVCRDQDQFTSFNWYVETTGSGTANEVGGINTTRTLVDANAGISMGIFEGTGSASTIGHGLGVAPKFIILKGLDNSSYSTVCYHYGVASDPETDYIQLNSTDDRADDVGMWNDTAPTSTVFSVGTGSSVNKSGETMAYYAFAEILGYSKFGFYEGTGVTTIGGTPLIYTGFRPQLVIIKNVEANSTYWMAMSSDRPDDSPQTPAGITIQNPFQNYLKVNDTTADTGGYDAVDMLSTGFRVANTTAWSSINTSGNRYLYCAWAQHPFGGEDTTPMTAS